jgi:uncharacterized protein YdaU (DUF1376 family)
MAEFPALPLFTDAFLADTDHLTDAEAGLYLRLLMTMWRAPECRLPNDDGWLSRKFRKTPQQISEQLRPLVKEFCTCDGNWIRQKRLLKVWQWCRRKREINSDSAKSRWGKEKRVYVRNASNPIHNITPLPPLRSLTPAESEAIVRLRASGVNVEEWNAIPDAEPRRRR